MKKNGILELKTLKKYKFGIDLEVASKEAPSSLSF